MNTSNEPSGVQRRAWLWGAGALAAAAGAGVAGWRLQLQEALPEAERALWALTFGTPQGGTLNMADFRGRPLLLNFWATWCPPCVEELPMIDAFWQEQAGKGVQVLGLAIDQPSAVKRFLERQPLTFPLGLAGLDGTALMRSLGNAAGGLPFSVMFAADGRILSRKLGQLTKPDLLEWVAKAA